MLSALVFFGKIYLYVTIAGGVSLGVLMLADRIRGV